MENTTAYLPLYSNIVEVQTTPQDSTILPVWEYLFKTLYGNKICSYYVNVQGDDYCIDVNVLVIFPR